MRQRDWRLPTAIARVDKRFSVAACTLYYSLLAIILSPSSKSHGNIVAKFDDVVDSHDLLDTMTLEERLFPLSDQIETMPISPQERARFYDQEYGTGAIRANELDSPDSSYQFQMLPMGLLYRSYLAGEKEPRMMWSALYDVKRQRTIWETALGGRVGLMRYGTFGAIKPQGFQLDLEGAVFARLIPSEPSTMLEGADFRFGLLNTWREDRLAVKWGYYHVSSHLGDEFLLANLDFERINYVRDAAIIGLIFDMNDDSQVYGEVANALGAQGGAKPWEFQFGAQYIPVKKRGLNGSPYLGANTYFRQDFDFRGGFNFIAGWNWFGDRSGERLRIGMQYYRGPSLQYSFFDRSERLIGGGIWFDY